MNRPKNGEHLEAHKMYKFEPGDRWNDVTGFVRGPEVGSGPKHTVQLDIFGSQPPQFKGATFSAERDGERLLGQLDRVRKLMLDGHWRTLAMIAEATGAPEASVSARLRDCRREGLVVQRLYIRRGLFQYHVMRAP